MRPKNGRPYYELTGFLDVTPDEADFCRRRTEGLLVSERDRLTLPNLLANAYALGLKDAAEYFTEPNARAKP